MSKEKSPARPENGQASSGRTDTEQAAGAVMHPQYAASLFPRLMASSARLSLHGAAHLVVDEEARRRRPSVREELEQAAASPWWQSEPCPSWCGWPQDHKAGDHPEDRKHFSGANVAEERILLTLEEPTRDGDVDLPSLDTYMSQGWRETEPRIVLSVNERPSVELTLSEADRLQEVLNRLLKAAGRG